MQKSCGLKINSRGQKSLKRAARLLHQRRGTSGSTTLRARETQNLASNFLGRFARANPSKRRGAPTNILLPADKHVLSHTSVSRTGTTLSHRIARRHAPTFLPLFFSRPSSKWRFFHERPTVEGQGHFNPPTFEVTFSRRKRRGEGENDDDDDGGASEKMGRGRRTRAGGV